MDQKAVTVHTDAHAAGPDAAKPLWSPGRRVGGVLFASGQVGVDRDGNVVAEDTHAQVRQALENVREVVEAAGMTFADIVKMRIILREPIDYEHLNDVRIPYYEERFPDGQYPASTALVTGPLVADGLKVEIEAVAAAPKHCFDTPQIVKQIPLPLAKQPHWRLGALGEDLLWTTGQPGLDLQANLVGPDAVSQARQSLVNTGYILEAGGFAWGDVLRMDVYLADLRDSGAVMEQVVHPFLAEHFPDGDHPALAVIEGSMPPPGMIAEIEVIARKGERTVVATPGGHTVRSGGWVFTGAITAMDASGLIAGADIRAQAETTLDNVDTALRAVGARFADIVQLNLWLDDVADYEALKEVRAPYFRARFAEGEYPASTAARGTVPGDGVRLAIQAIAWSPDGA